MASTLGGAATESVTALDVPGTRSRAVAGRSHSRRSTRAPSGRAIREGRALVATHGLICEIESASSAARRPKEDVTPQPSGADRRRDITDATGQRSRAARRRPAPAGFLRRVRSAGMAAADGRADFREAFVLHRFPPLQHDALAPA